MSREFHQEGQFHRLVKESNNRGSAPNTKRTFTVVPFYLAVKTLSGPFLLYRTHSDNFLNNENQPYQGSYQVRQRISLSSDTSRITAIRGENHEPNRSKTEPRLCD